MWQCAEEQKKKVSDLEAKAIQALPFNECTSIHYSVVHVVTLRWAVTYILFQVSEYMDSYIRQEEIFPSHKKKK